MTSTYKIYAIEKVKKCYRTVIVKIKGYYTEM